MAEKPTFLLVIECMTYNQSAYITDAMNGFVMQQTDFPFVAVIVDDASTDGEQEVIGKYVNEHFEHSPESGFKEWETEDAFWTFARHSENKSCHLVVVYLKKNLWKEPEKKAEVIKDWCESKYVALCEGDDYWTDPQKLQKQVGFLEEHEDFVVCASRHSIYFESEKRMIYQDQFASSIRKGQIGLELNNNNYFQIGILPQVLTLVYRNGVLEQSEWYDKLLLRSRYDQTVIYALVELGKIWVMNENMGVYRRHSRGIATSLSRKQAAEKMYYTWHDVYEVHPNEDVRGLYIGNLKKYCYFLVKHGTSLFGSEVRALKREYKTMKEPLKNKMEFSAQLMKAMVLRWISIIGIKQNE